MISFNSYFLNPIVVFISLSFHIFQHISPQFHCIIIFVIFHHEKLNFNHWKFIPKMIRFYSIISGFVPWSHFTNFRNVGRDSILRFQFSFKKKPIKQLNRFRATNRQIDKQTSCYCCFSKKFLRLYSIFFHGWLLAWEIHFHSISLIYCLWNQTDRHSQLVIYLREKHKEMDKI